MTQPPENDQVLPVTEHELAALTTLAQGPAPETSARLLGVEELRDNPAVVRAGLATLLLRGFGQVENGVFTAESRGEVLAAILGSARDWVRINVGAQGGEGVSAFVASELATLFVELQPTGIHLLRPLPPDFDVPGLVSGFLGLTDIDPVVPPPFRTRITRLSADGERSVDVDVPAKGMLEFDGRQRPGAEAWPQLAERLGYEGQEA